MRQHSAGADAAATIVWIGSPENLIYLEMIRPALARLSGALSRAQSHE